MRSALGSQQKQAGHERYRKGGRQMKVKDLMTSPAIDIHPDESVEVAAMKLANHNVIQYRLK